MSKKQLARTIRFRGFRGRAIAYLKKLGVIESGQGHKNMAMVRMIMEREKLPNADAVLEFMRGKSPAPRVQKPKPSPAKSIVALAMTRAKPLSFPPAPPKAAPPTFRIPNEEFFPSDRWRALRYAALKKHGARCQCCGATRRDGVRLHVDHVRPRATYLELQWELSNLQVLCEDCNLGKGWKDETDWRAPLNEDGKPIRAFREGKDE